MSDTSVGGISGYLTLDISDWNAKLDEAEAKARELAASDPTIRVGSNTGSATAELSAAQAAVDSLTAATEDLSAADDELAASQAAGVDLQASLNTLYDDAIANIDAYVDSLQAAAESTAEAAAASGDDAAALAAESEGLAEATAAAEALTGANQERTASEEEAAAAGEASNGSLAKMIPIIAGVISLLGPLSAYAAGVGGGLLGMGSAGVLAFLGIKNEIHDTSIEAVAYSDGLKVLKGDLDSLSQTSATAMLSSFQQAEAEITANLPELNTQIAAFSSTLGEAGDHALTGVISGMETANPLFQEGADLVNQYAANFQNWTDDGGLEEFVSYAQTELPQVTQDLGDVSEGVVSLVHVLTPLGNLIGGIAADGGKLVTVFDQVVSAFTGWENGLKQSGWLGQWAAQMINFVVNPVQFASDGVGQLNKGLGEMGASGQKGASGASAAARAASEAALSIGDIDKATKTAATDMDKFNQKLSEMGQVNLDEAQANIKYQQSLADANAAIAQNGKTLDLSTQAGRDNMTALDGIATSAHALIAAHQKAGESTTQLTADMGVARDSFIAAAKGAGISQTAAEQMADQFGLVPSEVPTAFVTSGAAQAEADAAAVKAAYDAIDRFITIRVNSIVTNSQNPNIGFGLGDGTAQGGTIGRGRGLAGGGNAGTVTGPGSVFSDLILTPLSPHEEVVNAFSASYPGVRPLLKSFNRDPASTMDALQRATQPQPSTLTGLSIVGTLDLGNGLIGTIKGVVQNELHDQGQKLSNGYRGL